MISCCSKVKDLGCFNFCDTIQTGVTAGQTGQYRINVVGGGYFVIDITAGAQIMFENNFNEDSVVVFTIIAPDGTHVLAADGSECFSVTSLPAIRAGAETLETGGII